MGNYAPRVSAASFDNTGRLSLNPGSSGVAFAGNVSGSGQIGIASGSLALVGASNVLSGAISGAGGLTLSGGSTSINAGAKLTQAKWTLIGAGTAVTLNENLTYGGTYWQGGWPTLSIASGDTLTLTGSAALGGPISGAGGLTLSGGSTSINAGATLTQAKWTLIGAGTAVALNENLTYGGTFWQGGWPTLSIASGDTLTLTGSAALGGPISGAGGLMLSGGSTSINAGAKLLQANWTLQGAGTAVALNESLTYGGTFAQGGGLSVASGDTLTLTGSATLGGAISGAGGLTLSSGSTSINAGAKLTQAKWTLIGAGTAVALNENLTYGGTFWQGGWPTLSIASGDTLTLTGSAALGGTISGAGGLTLSGGSTSINAGAKLTQAKWTLIGAGTAVALNENLTYAGTFWQGGWPTLSIASGDTLTLTGSPAIGGTIAGAGGLTLSGGTTSINAGAAMTQVKWALAGAGTTATLNETLAYKGTFSAGAGTQLTLSGGALTLDGPTTLAGVTVSSASAKALDLDGATTVSGLTVAGDAKADFASAITGTGTETISGASTLQFNATVAATQTVDFTGSGGELLLDAPLAFHGEISGFDTTGAGANDAIALLAAWSVGAFTENSSDNGGSLALSSGSSHISLNFLGNYQTGAFAPKPGSGGTTLLTFSA